MNDCPICGPAGLDVCICGKDDRAYACAVLVLMAALTAAIILSLYSGAM